MLRAMDALLSKEWLFNVLSLTLDARAVVAVSESVGLRSPEKNTIRAVSVKISVVTFGT